MYIYMHARLTNSCNRRLCTHTYILLMQDMVNSTRSMQEEMVEIIAYREGTKKVSFRIVFYHIWDIVLQT